jgi:antitoxin component YwqK of YwqJK toxin-antitoxin module
VNNLSKQVFHTLLACLLLPTSSLGDSIRINADDERLQHQNGILVLNDTVFSGELVSYHANAVVHSVTDYQNGKRDGRQLSWYDDDQEKSEAFFIAGRRHGEVRGWWSNGQIQYQRVYRDGLLEGETLEWSESGLLKYQQHYIAGREEGLQSGWHADGEPAFSYVFRDGRRYGVIASKPCFTVNPEATEQFNENL